MIAIINWGNDKRYFTHNLINYRDNEMRVCCSVNIVVSVGSNLYSPHHSSHQIYEIIVNEVVLEIVQYLR